MELYKLKIRAKTPFASPLQSDTFFGAFCWSYQYLYGEDKLKDLLDSCMEGEVPVIFSNAYPSGYLPIPMGIRDELRSREKIKDKEQRKRAYQENKKYKKCSLISLKYFLEIQKGKTEGYSDGVAKESAQMKEVLHNTISRELGTTSEELDGGGLFSRTESFTGNATYDLYILTSVDVPVLMQVLNLMFEIGIGGKKSSGKGYFVVEGELENAGWLMQCENANAFVAISNFIPAVSDPRSGFYKTFIKNGKLDREYAVSDTPFKKPLLFLESGSVFYTDSPKCFYGRCINHIAVQPNVIVNACTIALPLLIKEL